jgi:hypothetical protein
MISRISLQSEQNKFRLFLNFVVEQTLREQKKAAMATVLATAPRLPPFVVKHNKPLKSYSLQEVNRVSRYFSPYWLHR